MTREHPQLEPSLAPLFCPHDEARLRSIQRQLRVRVRHVHHGQCFGRLVPFNNVRGLCFHRTERTRDRRGIVGPSVIALGTWPAKRQDAV